MHFSLPFSQRFFQCWIYFFPSDWLCYFILLFQPLLYAGLCNLFPKLCFYSSPFICFYRTTRLCCIMPWNFCTILYHLPVSYQAICHVIGISKNGILGPEKHQRLVTYLQTHLALFISMLINSKFGLLCYKFLGLIILH